MRLKWRGSRSTSGAGPAATGAPSLARCRRLTVRGDVVFGRDVELAGDVALEHDGDQPLRIADGTRLGG